MGLIARDLPTLVFMLLPGFIAAGVFFTLTAHPKSSEFERLIQALIFTAILRVLTTIVRGSFLLLGRLFTFGSWSDDIDLVWSVFLSLPVGLLFAFIANRDLFHRYLRSRKVTTRTSYPSEWYGAFVRERRWVILHLTDRRRLYGWPGEWPEQPDKGHFLIDEPEWILDDNTRAPLYQVERFLVPASDVKMVEFMREDQEVPQDLAEVERIERLLIKTQKEEADGSEGTAAGTEPPAGSTGGDPSG